MTEQATIHPWQTIPRLPIRWSVFVAVSLGLIVHSRADGAQIQSFTLPDNPDTLIGDVHELTFTRDGTVLAADISDQPIHIWSISDGARLSTINTGIYRWSSLAFADDSETLLIGESDRVYRWAAR